MTPSPPRNLGALLRYRQRHDGARGHHVVASLVGETDLPWPHVYVDPGRSHDYSALERMHVVIATRPGVDAGRTIAEVFTMVDELSFFEPGYPTLVDIEDKHVAHVWRAAPLEVVQIRQGTPGWLAYFE